MYYSNYNDFNSDQQSQELFETVDFTVSEERQPPKKKRKLWPKLTALVLAAALLGGLAGGGAVYLWGGVPGSTTIYGGTHTPTAVSVFNVNQKDPLTPAQIYATYVGSTVGITTEIKTTNIFGQPVQNAASGSGFVITADGYIVTNYHVIDGASNIEVSFMDGKSYVGTLVGGDEENDIAVLKIDATGLTPVVIGSSDDLVVGDQVFAIGNPLGELTYSLTGGYVSALNRSVTMDNGRRMNYIQTDTAINSGNSGGPLFNIYGQVVGIVSAKLSSSSNSSAASVEGLGFAIPMDDVQDMITDIIEHGYVTGKPYMGIVGGSVSGEAQRYGTPAGAYVMGVVSGSGADKAGLQKGDIVTKIDDTVVASMDDLQNANKTYKAGDTATLEVSRS
ncbi:MAG TPA: trypsin-like peptidase domain-containing protein, partial [Pseudoflavonifractor sp.]|nr:trypsin-like peptidase domain-containing protein [Pseudoflavonifractor sp.]